MKKYVQTKNLPLVFDLSPDFFDSRKGKVFFQNIHFFVPPERYKTKHAVLWSVEAIENWLRGNQVDQELEALLARK